MDDHFYISLSSDGSKNYYPSNYAGDFTIKLPATLNLNTPGWVCGLCEIEFMPTNSTPKTLFVLMDICQESIVNSQTLPLLRAISIDTYKSRGKPLSFIYNKVFYMPVKQQQIAQIRVYIKSRDGVLASFTDKPLRCTLHFKRHSA